MVNKGRRSEVSIVDSRHNQQNSNYRDTIVEVRQMCLLKQGEHLATIPWVSPQHSRGEINTEVCQRQLEEAATLVICNVARRQRRCSCEFVVCKDASQLAAGTASRKWTCYTAPRKATSDGHSIISPCGSLSESWEWKVSGCIWSGNPTQQKDMEGPFSLIS